jgi:polyphosphate kinase
MLSADPMLGHDLTELFNHLTGYSRPVEYGRVLVAPETLREGLVELIRAQARPEGRITLKMNALVDAAMIEELYDAAGKGAEIDLVVRGICCLRAGVPGLSDSIRVRSILGRYLEHSRIFRFGEPGAPDTSYLVGSADLMPRNLDRRVEALVRVTSEPLQRRLDEILEINLADDTLAWTLGSDDDWTRVETTTGVNTHLELQARAAARARGDR